MQRKGGVSTNLFNNLGGGRVEGNIAFHAATGKRGDPNKDTHLCLPTGGMPFQPLRGGTVPSSVRERGEKEKKARHFFHFKQLRAIASATQRETHPQNGGEKGRMCLQTLARSVWQSEGGGESLGQIRKKGKGKGKIEVNRAGLNEDQTSGQSSDGGRGEGGKE